MSAIGIRQDALRGEVADRPLAPVYPPIQVGAYDPSPVAGVRRIGTPPATG